MAPFRNLLSPKTEFVWTQELNDCFEISKKEILQAVKDGIKSFDTSLPTVLSTDWSKNGIGFCLLQKVCSCKGDISPVCCKNGWRITLCNSRFTRETERNYSPVEGEGRGNPPQATVPMGIVVAGIPGLQDARLPPGPAVGVWHRSSPAWVLPGLHLALGPCQWHS